MEPSRPLFDTTEQRGLVNMSVQRDLSSKKVLLVRSKSACVERNQRLHMMMNTALWPHFLGFVRFNKPCWRTNCDWKQNILIHSFVRLASARLLTNLAEPSHLSSRLWVGGEQSGAGFKRARSELSGLALKIHSFKYKQFWELLSYRQRVKWPGNLSTSPSEFQSYKASARLRSYPACSTRDSPQMIQAPFLSINLDDWF